MIKNLKMGLKKAPISKLSIKTVHMNVHWKNHERFERFERLNVNVNVNVQGTPLVNKWSFLAI